MFHIAPIAYEFFLKVQAWPLYAIPWFGVYPFLHLGGQWNHLLQTHCWVVAKICPRTALWTILPFVPNPSWRCSDVKRTQYIYQVDSTNIDFDMEGITEEESVSTAFHSLSWGLISLMWSHWCMLQWMLQPYCQDWTWSCTYEHSSSCYFTNGTLLSKFLPKANVIIVCIFRIIKVMYVFGHWSNRLVIWCYPTFPTLIKS